MNNQEIMAKGQKYLLPTYSRLPIAMERGAGCKLWDADGNQYLDFVAGVAVNSVGSCNPEVVAAISNQAAQMIHCSNLYWNEQQVNLAEKLCQNSMMDKVFFCNSGAEANEGAIKLARKYAKMKGYNERYEIITMLKSFHGRTLATLTATGQEKVQIGFDPLPPGFKYVDFNDLDSLKQAISPVTCGIMIEPVQGEGGVINADSAYMRGIRELCDELDLVLICDEVQVGLGRTGKLFGYEHSDIEPDILTLAKALGGGAPIGCFGAKDSVAAAMVAGDHGSTFGGNPLVCAAGNAAFDYIIKENLAAHAAEMGSYLAEKLMQLKAECPQIVEVRGRGLLLGLQLNCEGAPIVKECLKRHLLINCTAGTVLRFVPPLIVTETEIDEMLGILKQAMLAVAK